MNNTYDIEISIIDNDDNKALTAVAAALRTEIGAPFIADDDDAFDANLDRIHDAVEKWLETNETNVADDLDQPVITISEDTIDMQEMMWVVYADDYDNDPNAIVAFINVNITRKEV